MQFIILFGILISSMAMENNIKWGGIKIFNPLSETYEKIYKNMREYSVRFLVRHHYETLKNENFRQKMQGLMSRYYDSIYHYYKLTDEERDFIENLTNLLM